MLIKAETTLALRCPDCGRLLLHNLSRFDFGREKTKEITCSCGSPQVVVSTKRNKSFWLEINCVICDSVHLYRLSAKELWSRDVVHLSCQETGLELGHIGARDKIKEYIKHHEEALEALVEEMGGQDYFDNAEVMLTVLAHVHTLAEEGNLKCACGKSRIELEIFPDRIELHCRHCGRMHVLPANAEQDALSLSEDEELELTQKAFTNTPWVRRKHDNQ